MTHRAIIVYLELFSFLFSFGQKTDSCHDLSAYNGLWERVSCTDTFRIFFHAKTVSDSLGHSKNVLFGWHQYKIRDSIIQNTILSDRDADRNNISDASFVLTGGFECRGNATTGRFSNKPGRQTDSVLLLPFGAHAYGFLIVVTKTGDSDYVYLTSSQSAFIKKSPYDYIVLSYGSKNKSDKIDLGDFNEYPLPDDSRLNAANNTLTDWHLKTCAESICIECTDDISYAAYVKKTDSVARLFKNIKGYDKMYVGHVSVPDGKIALFSHFEARGGSLSFYASESKQYRIENAYDVQNVFLFNDTPFFLSSSYRIDNKSGGALYQLVKRNGKWTAKLISDEIDAGPRLTYQSGDSLFILTAFSVYLLQTNLRIRKLFDAPFWWISLYPTSMVRDKEDLYIAMRKGILKMENFLNGAKPKWFVHK